ncbi:MAG: DUF2812 domain-containing protein [Lachnospiraceae bacterium]|nr:DUF2812 domain-containing protein [Lachnospiraceae bacterium]
MAKYKYQISTFNLFDYAGVERHLEKMAEKGWQFDSIGSFFWKYKKIEPATHKYSVTYIPEVSEFDPEPLEKQKDIEEYCREAGWQKVGNWLQMQIFCSENPEAVPIETDEELRLEVIGKSMKKNFLFSHGLLMAVFLMNMFTTFSTAKRNWVEFLSDSHRLWNTGLWMWGLLILLVDIAYYINWMRKAKRAVKEGISCPEPKGYRYWTLAAWGVLAVLILGLIASYTSGMLWFMVVYLTGIFFIIFGVRKVQMKLKKKGVSKEGNWAVTMILCVVLSLLFVGGAVAAVMVFDISLTGKKEPAGTILLNGKEWKIYQDTLPLYVEDFAETRYSGSSSKAREQSSFLVGYGDYEEYLFEGQEVTSVKVANTYEVITVKAEFLYDFLLDKYYEREFRYWDDEEREYLEFRTVYENENGKVCRQYYDDGIEEAVSARDWLILTEDKIVPMTLYLDDLTEEQMQIILEKLSAK